MNINKEPANKLIIALDGMDKEGVLSLLKKIPDLVWVKVGLELFTCEGPEIISILRDQGKKIFLDLKFHDIPTTVSRACFQAARTGAQLISIHSVVGKKALEMANEAAIEGSKESKLPSPTLVAVTVLTSWAPENFAKEMLIKQPLNKRVSHLAELAYSSGIGGCVCSPKEVELLRKSYPEPFELVTPGIRSIGSSINDQARVMDAADALNLGASRLVIGRAITMAEDPAIAFEMYCRKATLP